MVRNNILLLLLVLLLVYGSFVVFSKYRRSLLTKEGEFVVEQVEKFRRENNRLPESRAEMGLEDGETIQPYYVKRNEENYLISFVSGFDRFYEYRSESKEWVDLCYFTWRCK